MATPRVKKLTDYTYSPTWAVSEDAIRGQIDGAIDEVFVNLSTEIEGVQTVENVKTYTVSPIVPTPTTDFQASTKKYVDDVSLVNQNADHLGTWQGFTPRQTDPVQADIVESHSVTLDLHTSELAETNIIVGGHTSELAETNIIVGGHTAQLADNVTQLGLKAKQLEYLVANGGIDYGEITFPSDFPLTLPFTLYRDFDGKMKHNFNFANIEVNPTKTIYVNSTSGNDTSGDGTVGLPYSTINKALTIAEAAVETKILVNVTGLFYEGDICRSASYSFTNKTIILKSAIENTRILASSAFKNTGITWVADGGAYKGTRSNIEKSYNVVDLSNKDFYGIAKPLSFVADAATCKTTPNSYYCDYSDTISQIWVNRIDGSTPDSNLLALGAYPNISFTLNSSTLYIKDFEFYSSGGSGAITVNGDIDSTFVHENCIFSSNQNLSEPTANGLSVVNVGKTYGFGSSTAYNGRDGFNYHYASIPEIDRKKCLAFEYECLGHTCGINSIDDNNNATTAHEGIVALRVGTIGYNTKGPVQADVGGCYSLLYDCRMRDSLYEFGSNFESYDVGTIVLINCVSSGTRYIDIASTIPSDIRLQRFYGTKLGDKTYTIID